MNRNKQTTGDAILALRLRVLQAYKDAHADAVTRPGAFGLGAKIIMDELQCDFRVSCMLMDCWVAEHDSRAAPS